jgi:hypothetical protein
MSDFITVSGSTITGYYESVHSVESGIQVSIRSLVSSVPIKYLKYVASVVSEMTQGEKDAVDATLAATQVTDEKSGASALIDADDLHGRALRADILLTLAEINTLRSWLASFKTEVAAATNLADLKTRVAGLPAMGARTVAQLKTAFLNEITND